MMENRTKRVLHGEAELREYVLAPRDVGERLHTASDVVVEEIDRIVAAGRYPYNRDVQCAVEARLNIPHQADNGSSLSGVVYASQNYRDYQRLAAQGFEPFTPELLQRAYDGGVEIEILSENALGLSSSVRLTPRRIDGKLYAMKPRARNRHVPPNWQPAKLVA